jgi:NADPH-dependent ferric siderophore reductase
MTHHVHNPHANDELVVVLETSNPATAAVVESILEEEGLTFNLQGESLQEMIVVPFAAPIRVQVLKKDEARARELLKDIE